MNSHCFKLNRLYRMSFHLPNVGDFSGVESERTVSIVSLEKEKDNFCVVFTYSIMWAREIRKSHVAVE